jgi:hypothetical protein
MGSMNITISPSLYYLGDVVTTGNWSETSNTLSRSIRTDVAIDNTVVITDSGFSWGNYDMTLSIGYSKAFHDTLLAWVQGWPIVVVARKGGLFKAILKSVRYTKNKLIVDLSISERIN